MALPGSTHIDREIEDYIRATGGTEAWHNDAQYRHQMQILRHMLVTVKDSLEQEGVPPTVVQGCIHRIVMGAGARASDATQRKILGDEIYNLRANLGASPVLRDPGAHRTPRGSQ